jgi:site-specific DNA-adenine methylase
MNVWKLVKSNPEKIIKTVVEKSNKELISICKEITEKFNSSKPDTCMFMLMTMMSYTGSLIVDNKYKIGSLSPKIIIGNNFTFLKDAYYTNLLQVSEFLKSGKIYNTDYKKVLQKAKEGDFVFLDPPYIGHRYQFNYNKDEKLDTGVF